MNDRIDDLAAAQREQGKEIASHGEDLSSIKTELRALTATMRETNASVQAHTKILSEYTGARKVLHWLSAIGMGVAGYLTGKHGP